MKQPRRIPLPAAPRLLSCVLAALLSGGGAGAAPLTTGADFLLFTTGARPDGMGQAFSAVADDINTLSFNPAGLGNIRLPEVGYGYVNFPGDITFQFLGAGIPLGPAGVLGLGYLSMGTAPFDSTGGGGPLVSVMEQSFQAGWGLSLYDVHLGVSAKYVLRDLDGIRGDGFGVDLGARLRINPVWTLAGSVLNLGPGVSFDGGMEPLPTSAHLGTAFTLLEEGGQRLDLALDAAWNIVTNTQTFGGGAEYCVQEGVLLRAGYTGRSTDGSFQLDGVSAGAGVRFSFLQFDYAFQPFNEVGAIHRFSGILRWEGPWMKGVEPNPPKYVSLGQTARGLEVRWEAPQGPSLGYRVLAQPLDGGPGILSPQVSACRYVFEGLDPGTLYKVSVRTVGEGGSLSYPSPEDFYKMKTSQKSRPRVQVPAQAAEPIVAGNPVPAAANGLEGEQDGVGLKLSWKEVPGAKGYHLYRQDPSGRVLRITLAPRAAPPLWISGLSGWEGSTFLSTAILEEGREKSVGGFTWEPSRNALSALRQDPGLRLKASAQQGGRVFLDWDKGTGALGYSLFISREPDGILEHLKDYSQQERTDLLKVEAGKGPKVYFLVAPRGLEGSLSGRSNISQAELFF